MSVDLEHLQQWIGKTEAAEEELERWPVAALLAALDVQPEDWPKKGDPIPPGAHWNYFVPRVPQSKLGIDGHPQRGDFLPPVSLPRRMWAGSRIRYHQPLRLGETVHRLSTVADVSAKEGKSGSLVFLTLRHEYEGSNGLALTEEQDLVYRDNPPPGAPVPAPKQAPDNADWSRRILPDPTLLFRYSAVTLNAHRIHYDFPYVTETEGYPGLIVHGQLIATLLLHLAQSNRPNGEIEEFEFRAMSPLFCNQPFFVEGVPQASGREGDLWARTEAGGLAMKADIRWR